MQQLRNIQRLNYLITYQHGYRNYGRLTSFQHTKSQVESGGDKLAYFVEYYRKYGHVNANLDPLNLAPKQIMIKNIRNDAIPGAVEFGLNLEESVVKKNLAQQLTDVKSLEEYLKKMYCGSVGVEFEHIENYEQKQWLYENYEKYMAMKCSDIEKVNIHNTLVQGEAIDHYMHKKFTTFKRYSGEGGEASLIALRAIYAQASELGVRDVVQSMAHRGRFGQIIALLDYPASHIFRKVAGRQDIPEEYTAGVCDVVHHLSGSIRKAFHGTGCRDKEINVTVVHNPSHLEAANPVSQGKTKAKQDDYGNQDYVLNLQLHGDAAFSGQGIIYESLQLSGVPNYEVGGTVHLILNNQIGYTTSLSDARSTRYCTDVVKGFNIPVIHVNSEDVEAVHKVSKLVVAYRQKFNKDIVLDLITYRRYGHNEVDEPEFTQPLMYRQVRNQEEGLPKKYSSKLQSQGLVTQQDVEKLRDRVFDHLEKEYKKSLTENQTLASVTDPTQKGSRAFTHKWAGLKFSQFAQDEHYLRNTGSDCTHLKQLAEKSVLLKPGFKVHPRIQKFFIEDRLQQIKNNEFDWATAECMAVQTLLEEGYHVRMSGEDVERGTFSQRHWVLIDQQTEEKYTPIQADRLQVSNSPLIEPAVIGFDWGYAMENPKNLVFWEAQFGDFYNTGQYMVDVFVTCSEEKWMRQGSLVMLLPHGYDGAGPEHSSCRLERWLQNGVDLPVNFQVVNPSTPANVFHMIRRQMLRSYRKPLIVASAKILLKHKKAKSTFEQIGPNTQFEPIIIKRKSRSMNIVLCSGKISYDLEALFEENGIVDYSLVTIEELLPFPSTQLKQAIQELNEEANLYWVQEEPKNAGAYKHAYFYCKDLGKELQYIGRPAIPSVAVGSSKKHAAETQKIMESVLSILK